MFVDKAFECEVSPHWDIHIALFVPDNLTALAAKNSAQALLAKPQRLADFLEFLSIHKLTMP